MCRPRLFRIGVGAAFVVVVGFIRVRRLSECCWFDCRCRGAWGRGSCWLVEPAARTLAFYAVPFRAILRRGAPSRVVVRSLLSLRTLPGCLYSLMSSSISWPIFLASGIAGLHVEMSFAQRPSWCFDNHSCMFQILPALPALRVARTLLSTQGSSSSSSSSFGTSSKEELLLEFFF